MTIIGSGYRGEEEKIQSLISNLHLESRVKLLGYVSHERLGEYFEEADIGVVHVPNVNYFRAQPSTKLYEYWSHGLPVLASNYPMNELEVSEGTGSLYRDSAEGFCEALTRLVEEELYFEYTLISKKVSQNSWSNIVNSELVTILVSSHRIGSSNSTI